VEEDIPKVVVRYIVQEDETEREVRRELRGSGSGSKELWRET
jgi:hypothetical protein